MRFKISLLAILVALTFLAIGVRGAIVGAGAYNVTSIQLPTTGNGTWITENNFQFNITLNYSASNVTYIVNQTYYITATNISTTTGTLWGANITGFNTGLGQSNWDNTSAKNVTVAVDRGGINATNITGFQWWIDTANPVVTKYASQINATNTSSGDKLFMSYNVVENASSSCSYEIYFKTNNTAPNVYVTTLEANLSSLSTKIPTCNITISPGNFTKNGYYTFQPYVIDRAGRVGYGTANYTAIIYTLKANEWNLISALNDDNKTLRGANFMQWTRNHSTITYISKWNETAQGFITHQHNNGVANTTPIYMGNALYVYPSSDSVLIRINETITSNAANVNVTLYNTTAYGPWNLIGNIWDDQNTSALVVSSANVTWVSFHNITNGYYYMYLRGFGPVGNDQTVLKGLAFWMDHNDTADLVYDRRSYRTGV